MEKMTPAEKAEFEDMRKMSRMLIDKAQKLSPVDFQTILMATMANVVGNIPDDYWNHCKIVTPCREPNCDCQLTGQIVMAAMHVLRLDHRQTISKRGRHN